MKISIRLFTAAFAFAIIASCLTGCMLPKYTRLIPENKSARIRIVSPLYGYIEIDTRVPHDTNTLAEMPRPGFNLGPSN